MTAANKLRTLFEGNDIVMGMLIGLPTPVIVELGALAGLDYVVLDTEHSTYGLDVLETMVTAADARGAATLVRFAGPDPHLVARVLDMGVDGVKFSKVSSPAQAEAIVRHCRFPPLGERSPEPATRSAHYGTMDRDEYDARAKQTVVVVGVDTREGLANVDEIVAVPGVDAVQVGPSDMSWSLGVRKDSAEFAAALRRIADAAYKAGRSVIRVVYTPEQMADEIGSDPPLHIFHWSADRMNISRFIRAGTQAGKQMATEARGDGRRDALHKI